MSNDDDRKKDPKHVPGPHPQKPAHEKGGKGEDPMATPPTDTSNNPEPEPEKK